MLQTSWSTAILISQSHSHKTQNSSST